MKKNGFTLIEVLVAMIILSISMSVIIEGFVTANEREETMDDISYVSTWAENKINEIDVGSEMSRNGSFEREGRVYYWNLGTKYYDTQYEDCDFKIEWDMKGTKKNYTIDRLVLKNR